MNFSTTLNGKWLTLAHFVWYVCALCVAVVLLGALPGYPIHYGQIIRVDPYALGPLNQPLQILIGASDLLGGFISFGLAVLLFCRKPNDRMALFASFVLLITAPPSGISLDYFLTAYLGAPPVYLLGQELQTPLWVLLYCIFPDGRFVPRWTRWLLLLSIPMSFAIFADTAWFIISRFAIIFVFGLLTYAQVYRYRQVSSSAQRRQTKWMVLGFALTMVLSLAASLIYKQPSPPLINVFSPLLAIAILHSRLWDIDVIIRKTLTYALVTGALLLVFFGSVVILQQGFASVTGSSQDEIVTVVSTLAIAALFVPVRNRIQNLIDQRFYRKKYDAQQVLNDFSKTVRDETDLEKLTARLMQVVDETMQPKSVSVWLKKGK